MQPRVYFLLILIVLIAITIGCSPKIQETNKDIKNNVEIIENVSNYSTKQPESPKEISKIKENLSSIESLNKTQAKPADKEVPKKESIQKSDSSLDTFEGTSIDSNKYSVKIRGSGSIVQDSKIIMKGKTSDDIIWNVLYTKQNIAFDKDFIISADVDLAAGVLTGDAALIIGIEDPKPLSSPKQPKEGYCELSTGAHGNVIRMASSGAEARSVPQTTGKMTLSYNSQTEKLTCSFNSQKIVENQLTQSGEFVLTLRSVLHSVSYGWRDEFNGGGNFTAIFDNLNITQE